MLDSATRATLARGQPRPSDGRYDLADEVFWDWIEGNADIGDRRSRGVSVGAKQVIEQQCEGG